MEVIGWEGEGAVPDGGAQVDQAGAFGEGVEVPLGREAQGGEGGALARTGGPFHERHGQVGGGAVIQQALGDGLQGAGAHEEGKGGFGTGQLIPVGV